MHSLLTRRHILMFAVVSGLFLHAGKLTAESRTLKLATTTSTENSGLLKFILPFFEEQTGIEVLSIAVGTGKALRLGEMGDVDVVMVHAKSAEEEFLSRGFGTRREEFMYNDFVIVGPKSDPADIASSEEVTKALAKIASSNSLFVSRGDDSGTHKREISLWQATSIVPETSWYRETGQGMGKVLQIASELEGYTLTDRGTWLNLEEKLGLRLLFEADPKLFNHYGVIPVNPAVHDHVNSVAAESLVDWLISEEGQKRIGEYVIKGHQAFIPSRSSGSPSQ